MNNCIQFINPLDPEQVLVDIPCEQINYPNFDNEKFDSDKFDKFIQDLYSVRDSSGIYPYMFENNYIHANFPDQFHLHTSQRFISKYVNYHNNFSNGCLIFHYMGSGKMCTSIVVAEAYKQYFRNQKKRVMVVVPASLVEQYKNELIWSGCTDDIRIDGVSINNQIKKFRERKPKQLIDKHSAIESIQKRENMNEKLEKEYNNKKIELINDLKYDIYSHEYFINRLKDILNMSDSKKMLESMKIKNRLNSGNQLLIIDEIQNLIAEVTSESGKRYDIVKNGLKLFTNKNNRYLLLTGTPIKDKPDEIGKLINLLNPRVYFPLQRNEFNTLFIDNNQMINKDLFRWMTKGYVSYFKGGNPKFFPNKNIKYVYHTMSSRQLDTYTDVLKAEQDKIKKRKKDNAFKRHLNLGGNDDTPKTFLTIPREYCVSYLKPHVSDKNKIEDFKTSIYPYNDYEKILNIVKEDYSPKISYITKQCIETPSKSFVYCDFKVFGTYIFQALFEKLGYDIIPYKRTNLKNPGKRIIIWSGGLNDDEKKQIANAIRVFNSPENKDGRFIKVVIGTQTIKEGISFKQVNNVHIVSPWWNNSRIEQVIARAIRFRSHEEGATVNVYKHVSIMSENLAIIPDLRGVLSRLSVDQYMDMLSLRKQSITSEFENCLKESSVDCVLNKYGNLIRLIKISEFNWMDRQYFSYYLNESTHEFYDTDLNEIRIIRDDEIYCRFQVERTGKVFESIEGYPSITYENVQCSSGTNINEWYRKNKEYAKIYELMMSTTYLSRADLQNYSKEQLINISRCFIKNNPYKAEIFTKYLNDANYKEKSFVINTIISKEFPDMWKIYNTPLINKEDPEFDDLNAYKKMLWEQDIDILKIL